VARITWKLRTEMVGRLSRRASPVVTSRTGADYDTGVVELCPGESLCVVTGFTSRSGRNVLWRLDNVVASQAQPTCMAGCAILCGPFEYSINVTRLTPNVGMLS